MNSPISPDRPVAVRRALSATRLIAVLGGLTWTLFAVPAANAGDLPDPVAFRVQMEMGRLDKARAWLAAGLDPNFLGDRIGSGLMIGAWEGNIALMALFHAHGADIDRSNALGETALMHAAWRGHAAAVDWLLARGARPDLGDMRWSALHYTAFAGQQAIAERLLAAGARLDARTPNGSTALMMAIYEGREEVARWLVERGANVHLRNDRGEGALEWARKFNHPQLVSLLASVAPPPVVRVEPPPPPPALAPRSEPAPKDIADLLALREALVARGLNVDEVDRRLAAARARHARAALGREELPPRTQVLEITARRSAPTKQQQRLRER